MLSGIQFVFGWMVLYGIAATAATTMDQTLLVEPYPTHLIVQKGSRLVLDCPVTGSSDKPLQYYWTKDDVKLEPQKHFLMAANGSLIFERIMNKRRKGRDDTGFYECFVRNEYGTVIGRRVRLEIARQSLSIIPTETNVRVGGVVRLECRINLSVRKPPFYIWSKGHVHLENSNRVVSSLGILQIYNVTSEDAGNYVCKVLPSYDQIVDILEKSVTLNVYKDPDGTPDDSYIINTPSNVTVTAGNSVMLECLPDGKNPYAVTWNDKDGVEIYDEPGRIILSGNKNLEIKNVRLEDSGAYVCVIRESTGNSPPRKKTYILKVHTVPVITHAPVSVRNPLTQLTRLSCQARGSPEPIKHWYKNGKKMIPASNMGDNELRLPGHLEDTGYYQCFAENFVGVDVATVWIEIVKQDNTPDAPGNIVATANSSTEVLVTWQAAKTSSTLLAYTINYYKVGAIEPSRQATTATEFILKALEPFTNYSIAVRGFSDSGAGHLSERVVVTTLEAVPTAIPEVQIDEDTISSFRVTWSDVPEEHRHGIINQHKLYYGTIEKTTVLQNLDGAARSHLVTGLEPDTPYRVRVLSGNSAGYPNLTIDKIPWVTFRTPRGNQEVLPTPVLELKAINNSAVLLKWNGQQYPDVSMYRVTLQKLLESGPVREFNIEASVSELLITKLENNTFYSIELVVKGLDRTVIGIETKSYHSIDLGLPRRPCPPRLLDPRSPTPNVIQLRWNRPRTDMNITYYTVRYQRRDENPLLAAKEIVSDQLSVVIEELSPFSWYVIAVKAHTATTSSPYCKPVFVQTKEGVPSPPERVTAEVVSPGTVKLRWGPPKKQNGIITFYIIYYNIDKDMPDQGWNSLKQNGSTMSVLVGDLTREVYYFKLKACTNAGEGKPSTIVAIETHGCHEEPCPKCEASYPCGYAPKSSNDIASLFEQRLGIIIGCAVGLVSIIACTVFVIIRHRQYRRMYTTAQTPTVSGSSNSSIGRYLSDPLRRDTSSDDSSCSPILGRLTENENSDSKGGVISPLGPFCNGMKTALFPNGRTEAIMSAEQRALLSPSNSSQGNDDSTTESHLTEGDSVTVHYSPENDTVDIQNDYRSQYLCGHGQESLCNGHCRLIADANLTGEHTSDRVNETRTSQNNDDCYVINMADAEHSSGEISIEGQPHAATSIGASRSTSKDDLLNRQKVEPPPTSGGKESRVDRHSSNRPASADNSVNTTSTSTTTSTTTNTTSPTSGTTLATFDGAITATDEPRSTLTTGLPSTSVQRCYDDRDDNSEKV